MFSTKQRAKWLKHTLGWICTALLAQSHAATAVSPDSDKQISAQSSLWSLQPIRRPTISSANIPGSRNPIDRFVFDRLNKEGLTPSPEADRRTLIRRLGFDLLGLPPTPEEVDRFVEDRSPMAYER